MRNLFFLIIFVLLCQFSTAQNGQIITTKLDTLSGKVIVNLGGKYAADELQIKIDKTKTKFKAYQIREVKFDNDVILVPIKFEQRIQFAQVMARSSYLVWYRYIDVKNDGNQYTMNLLMKQNGEQRTFSTVGFRNRIADFLNDCPEVSQLILDGELKAKEVSKIVVRYSDCIEGQQLVESDDLPQAEIDSVIDPFIIMIQQSPLANNEDLLSMLDDVNQKLKNGKSIPNYLQQGVIEQLGNNATLINQFKELIAID